MLGRGCWGQEQGGHSKASQKDIEGIQKRRDGGLEQGGNSEDDVRWSGYGQFKVEP